MSLVIPENFSQLVIISENYRTEETYEDQLVMKLILVSRSKQSVSTKMHGLNLTSKIFELRFTFVNNPFTIKWLVKINTFILN